MSFLYGFFLWLLLPLVAYVVKSKKQNFSQTLRWVVLALLIVTMARPVLPQSVSSKEVMSHSAILALDLSASMNANDIKPTRAKASRESIKRFLEVNKKDQIALVGFTTNPLLLCPPTTDHALVKMALENMNQEYILTKGTDLKKLLKKVAKFKDEEKKLILFSDGGDELIDDELVDFVVEENIEILVVGMATKQGSSVEQKDGTLLEDEKGNIVVSKLNGSLKKLAEQSGGEFMIFSTFEEVVEVMQNWLSGGERQVFSKESRSYFELAFVPLFLALVFFFLSATRFSKKLILLLLFVGVDVQASSLSLVESYYLQNAYEAYEERVYDKALDELQEIEERSLESELLLAHIYYKQEKYKKAKSVLNAIKSTNVKLKQQLYYELGNCEFKMAYWSKAKKNYVKALQLGKDEDTEYNLKIVLFKEEAKSSVGFNNPSGAEASNGNEDNVEESDEQTMSQKKESAGGSGGSGSKQSKQSTVKVTQSDTNKASKRVMSSKAYDLINEGYIREEKPW